MNLQKLEDSIGYKFQNKHLLITAINHMHMRIMYKVMRN